MVYIFVKIMVNVVNDIDINGFVVVVLKVLSFKGFIIGFVGNNDGDYVFGS